MQIWTLINLLVGHVGAPVVDDTRLSGTFDVDFRWSPEMAPTDNLPSIYTVLQEQLGLKLEPPPRTRGSVHHRSRRTPSPD